MYSLLLLLAACGATPNPVAAPVALVYRDCRPTKAARSRSIRPSSFATHRIGRWRSIPRRNCPRASNMACCNSARRKRRRWSSPGRRRPPTDRGCNCSRTPTAGRSARGISCPDKNLELPTTITVALKPSPVQAKRTLLFRRSTRGDGLRYAVRGYAQGRLKLGDKDYAVLLIDGNGDGLLDTVGHDRLWIDLDGDGHFDLLMEQYPLGKPITHKGDIFVVRSDPLAAAVVVNQRNIGEGKLRLTLAHKHDAASKISAELISDIGEFVAIDKLDEFVSVPYGEYRISSLSLELPDAAGKSWSYYFSAEAPREFSAPLGQKTTVELMKDFEMNVVLNGSDRVKPDATLVVTPNLMADHSFALSRCNGGTSDEGKAEVLLLGPDGKLLQRSVNGFG